MLLKLSLQLMCFRMEESQLVAGLVGWKKNFVQLELSLLEKEVR